MSGQQAPDEMRGSPLGPYRVRGRNISRLEGFSDAVFGFSATLLVVSLEVPQTYAELAANLRGFGAFGLSFLALVFIWLAHRGFFRRYGLSDSWVTFLNMVLLFVVLFFVYPLKFVAITFVEWVFGLDSRTPAGAAVRRFTAYEQLSELWVIYGLGFALVFLCIALLYLRAYARREALGLSELEIHDARTIFGHYMIFVVMAVVSILLTLLGLGGALGGISGWVYGLLGPVMTVYWWHRSKRRDAMEAALAG